MADGKPPRPFLQSPTEVSRSRDGGHKPSSSSGKRLSLRTNFKLQSPARLGLSFRKSSPEKDVERGSSPAKSIRGFGSPRGAGIRQSFSTASSTVPDSALHVACRDSTSVTSLQAYGAVSIPEASTSNLQGETPLHVLANNHALLAKNEPELVEFCLQLWKLYPMAIITNNADHKIPFEANLEAWVDSVMAYVPPSPSATSSVSKVLQLFDNPRNPPPPPTPCRMTPEVYCSLQVLSVILQDLEDVLTAQQALGSPTAQQAQNFAQYLQHVTVHDIRFELCKSIASIPNLVAALFHLPPDQRHVLQLPMVQRVLASRYSVGTWLTRMLRSPEGSELVLEYLQQVSQLDDDEEEMEIAMAQLPEFVPSLLSLGRADKIEEFATTPLVSGVLDRIISRPFLVTVVFCDALFLVLLLSGYRGAIHRWLTGQDIHPVHIAMTSMGIFYFLIRELGKLISLVSNRVTTSNLWTFWSLTDLGATLLALSSTCQLREFGDSHDTTALRSMLAVTTGFLWLRVLSFLKGINMQLATFVLAIIQITRDILWFCVILCTLVVSFAQMFYTLMVPATCSLPDNNSRECDQAEYYLKVYTILLGDFGLFSREQFTTVISVCLAVLYTFMVVLVLLNVLIAVASDSYEKCLLRSQKLFGRARVMMIAELVCFQNLMQWRNDSSASRLFMRSATVMILVWVVCELNVLITSDGDDATTAGTSLVGLFLDVVLFGAMTTFVRSTDIHEEVVDEESEQDFFGTIMQSFVLRILGSSRDILGNGRAEDEIWRGRMHYLHKEMIKLSQENWTKTEDRFEQLQAMIQEAKERKER